MTTKGDLILSLEQRQLQESDAFKKTGMEFRIWGYLRKRCGLKFTLQASFTSLPCKLDHTDNWVFIKMGRLIWLIDSIEQRILLFLNWNLRFKW